MTFIISRVIPGDPAAAAAGTTASADQIAAVKERLGLDKPLPEQYVMYISRLLHGDFGQSVVSSQPVIDDFLARLPASIELAIVTVVLFVPLGIGLGVLAAHFHGRWMDMLTRMIAVVGVAMPVFWLALIAQLVFSGYWKVLPTTGRLSPEFSPPPHVTGLYTVDALVARQFGTFADAALHLLLPGIVLAIASLAVLTRMTRSSMLEVMEQDYIRTARSKGVSELRVLIQHGLRNSLLPIVTVIAVQMGGIIAWQFLAEYVFGWPGIGSWAVAGIFNSDFNVIMLVALFGATLYVSLNFLADVSYILLDPRVRDTQT